MTSDLEVEHAEDAVLMIHIAAPAATARRSTAGGVMVLPLPALTRRRVSTAGRG